MIFLTPLLAGLARQAGIGLDEVLLPIRQTFWNDRGMPRDFRSDKDAPSSAGSMKADKTRITLPTLLPYVAGVSCGDNVRLTGVELAPGALWYGDFNEAKIVLKKTTLPMAMAGGMTGRRIRDVVSHPALEEVDDIILSVTENNGQITFRTTNACGMTKDPIPNHSTPRADWATDIDEMERRRMMAGRKAA